MEQNSNAWLEWRKQGIGASDTPAILGVSRFTTPFQLWNEKLGIIESQVDSFITDLGHRFEPVARSEFALKEGYDLTPKIVEHEEISWLRASLDGDNEEEDVFAEIKYVGLEKFNQVKETGEVLEEHYPQIQHQYTVTGRKRCAYIVYTLNEKKNQIDQIYWIWPTMDEEYIKKTMWPALQKFWKCLQTQTPPALIAKDIVSVRGTKLLAEKYIKIKKKIDALTGQLDAVKSQVISCSKHPNFKIGVGNNIVKISSSISKGRVKYSDVPELKDVDLDKYRGAPSRSFRVTVPKKQKDQ